MLVERCDLAILKTIIIIIIINNNATPTVATPMATPTEGCFIAGLLQGRATAATTLKH